MEFGLGSLPLVQTRSVREMGYKAWVLYDSLRCLWPLSLRPLVALRVGCLTGSGDRAFRMGPCHESQGSGVS